MRKRRPEILKPSLKLLTPYEQKVVDNHGKEVLEMWKSLYARNKWKPQEPVKNYKK
jgi:hypothetical protein